MKKPLLNGVNFTENNFSLDSDIKDKLFLEAKEYFVSFFDSVTDKTPKEISITEALSYIRSENFHLIINKIRETKDKSERNKLKKTLPCITVSGTFKNGHASSQLKKHSGFIQIDIDSVPNPIQLKELISKDYFVFSCFISPSGNGVKAIAKIPIENHSESFEFVRIYFLEKYKIEIDKSCKDVGRLMYLSYDKSIFINETSLIMNQTSLTVNNIIREIERKKIDITEPYENWVKIGFAFVSEFNESGRDLYHSISKQNSKYSYDACNEQYNKCLKSNNNQTSVKSFFHLAKEKGVYIKTNTLGVSDNSKKNKQSNTDVKEKPITNRFLLVGKYINNKYDLRFNLLSHEVEQKECGMENYIALNEYDLYYELQSNDVPFSQANLNALLRSKFVKKYDPIEEYFESLPKWDGVTDYIGKLCSYITVKDQERFVIQFRKMFVRCIACSLGGIFNKQAFIFVGGQNTGKSTFTRWLCPKKLQDYLAENISTDKDSLIALAENFFIVLDELATFNKIEIKDLKSFFTKDKIKVRRPFDKKPEISARRANFIGSTNTDDFLTDETGSVRWICFNLIDIDFAYSKAMDMDFVWAQAYYLFKTAFKYELTTEELLENSRINLDFQRITAEMEFIQKHFEPATKEKHQHFLSSSEILHLLSLEYSQSIRNVTNVLLGKALKILGFEKCSSREGTSKLPTKGYYINLIKSIGSLTTLP